MLQYLKTLALLIVNLIKNYITIGSCKSKSTHAIKDRRKLHRCYKNSVKMNLRRFFIC